MGVTVQTIGLLAVAVIGITAWMGRAYQFAPNEPLRFRAPGIALQLVRSVDDVKKIVGDLGNPNRDVVRNSLRADYLFIVAYWLLYVAMSVLLAQGDLSWDIRLAVAAGVGATVAAGFDVLENQRIIEMLSMSLDKTTQPMIDGVRQAALVKWALIFIAMALLAPLFFGRSDWVIVIGGLYLLSAVIGLIGLWHARAIEWASYPMAVGLILVAFLFTFWPGTFLEGFCLNRN